MCVLMHAVVQSKTDQTTITIWNVINSLFLVHNSQIFLTLVCVQKDKTTLPSRTTTRFHFISTDGPIFFFCDACHYNYHCFTEYKFIFITWDVDQVVAEKVCTKSRSVGMIPLVTHWKNLHQTHIANVRTCRLTYEQSNIQKR